MYRESALAFTNRWQLFLIIVLNIFLQSIGTFITYLKKKRKSCIRISNNLIRRYTLTEKQNFSVKFILKAAPKRHKVNFKGLFLFLSSQIFNTQK